MYLIFESSPSPLFSFGSIYIYKSGPSTKPCGTPCVTSFVVEFKVFIVVNCRCSFRNDLNQSLVLPLIP